MEAVKALFTHMTSHKKSYILCILLIEIFSKRSRESLYMIVIIVKGQAFEDLHNKNICVVGFQTEIKSRGKDPQLSKMKSLSILVVLTSLGGLCLSLPGAPIWREMDRKKLGDHSPTQKKLKNYIMAALHPNILQKGDLWTLVAHERFLL